MLAAISSWQIWYAIPLIVTISLVYGATRHEEVGPILGHAWKSLVWIVGFMAIIFLLLMWSSWGI